MGWSDGLLRADPSSQPPTYCPPIQIEGTELWLVSRPSAARLQHSCRQDARGCMQACIAVIGLQARVSRWRAARLTLPSDQGASRRTMVGAAPVSARSLGGSRVAVDTYASK